MQVHLEYSTDEAINDSFEGLDDESKIIPVINLTSRFMNK
jgi:hypothetical protein